MSPSAMDVQGPQLRQERVDHNITQMAVRQVLGWRTRRIVDIERGRSKPTDDEVKSYLAAVFTLRTKTAE